VFNGQSKDVDNEYTTLNYNGHAYVPVRFVAEHMGGNIRYEESSKSIMINYINYVDESKLTDIYRNLKYVEKEITDKNQIQLTYGTLADHAIKLTYRKLHNFENLLTEEEVNKIRETIYEIVGLRFPLVLNQFILNKEPSFTGIISEIDYTRPRVLITAIQPDPTKRTDVAWVTLTEDAKIILQTNPDDLKRIEDLQVGQQVRAWFVGGVNMSDPAQAAGVKLEIIASQ
jgi:hypothetical protein